MTDPTTPCECGAPLPLSGFNPDTEAEAESEAWYIRCDGCGLVTTMSGGALSKLVGTLTPPDFNVDRCPSCGGVREVFPDGSGAYCKAEDKTWRYQ